MGSLRFALSGEWAGARRSPCSEKSKVTTPISQDNSRRQKQLLNQRFETLCAVLEERKAELLQALAREQEQKLQRVRGLIRQYGDHLEVSSKLVESAIQSMEEPQMALYLQVGPGGRQAAQWLEREGGRHPKARVQGRSLAPTCPMAWARHPF